MKKLDGISKIYLTNSVVRSVIVFKDSTNKVVVELPVNELSEQTKKYLDGFVNSLLKDVEDSLK